MLATAYIKIGIFLHIIFAGIMVTNSDIIPPHEPIQPEEGEDPDSLSFALRLRFWSKPHGSIYGVFFIGLLIFIAFKNTILLAIIQIGKYTYSIVFKNASKEDIFADSTQCENIYKEYPIDDLKELYEKAKKELKDFLEVKSIDFSKFRSLRFIEEQQFSEENQNQVQSELRERVKCIEATVDGLLLDLYGKEQFFNFDGLTYELKLDYLNRQSEELEEI